MIIHHGCRPGFTAASNFKFPSLTLKGSRNKPDVFSTHSGLVELSPHLYSGISNTLLPCGQLSFLFLQWNLYYAPFWHLESQHTHILISDRMTNPTNNFT